MDYPNDLRNALKHLYNLPAIPSIAQKILSLKITTNEGERALLELIEKDPPILSKIIGLANSPLFGTGRKILALNEAAALLGSRRVKMIALSFAMLSSMTKKQEGLLNRNDLWKHCLAAAMTMDTIGSYLPRGCRPSDDEIYLAGLLHDFGYLVLDYLAPQLSDQFHTRLATDPGGTIDEVEAEMLEISHSDLGAELGRHWNLPESIISAMRFHHTPNIEQVADGHLLVSMTNMAEKMLPPFGIADSVQMDITVEEWKALGIDPLKADEIKVKVDENIKSVAELIV